MTAVLQHPLSAWHPDSPVVQEAPSSFVKVSILGNTAGDPIYVDAMVDIRGLVACGLIDSERAATEEALAASEEKKKKRKKKYGKKVIQEDADAEEVGQHEEKSVIAPPEGTLIVPCPTDPTKGYLYLPPGENSLVIVDHWEQLAATARWPVWQEPPPSIPTSPCFEVRDSVGKGKGMFASKLIKEGEMIVQERPLFVTRCVVDQEADGKLEAGALEHLAPLTKERFLSLANAQPPGIHPVPGRLLTNSFAIDFDYESTDDILSGGVYEYICRANQDCVQSVHYHFSFQTFTGRLFAIRDIHPGEEITITYAPLLGTGEARRALLHGQFRFDCLCPTCTLLPHLAEESDARRILLKCFDTFVRGGGMPSLPMLLKALAAAEKEELLFERAFVLKAGTAAVAKSGQLEMAVDWARKAAKAFVMLEGEESFFSVEARKQQTVLELTLEARLNENVIDS